MQCSHGYPLIKTRCITFPWEIKLDFHEKCLLHHVENCPGNMKRISKCCGWTFHKLFKMSQLHDNQLFRRILQMRCDTKGQEVPTKSLSVTIIDTFYSLSFTLPSIMRNRCVRDDDVYSDIYRISYNTSETLFARDNNLFKTIACFWRLFQNSDLGDLKWPQLHWKPSFWLKNSICEIRRIF